MKKRLFFTFRFKNGISYAVVFLMFFSFVMTLRFSVSETADAISQEVKTTPLVIIDAGHGGEDGGTQASDGTLEKDINLSISYKIQNVLNEKGINTYMIRDGDYLIYDDSCSTAREKKVSDIHNRMNVMKNNPDAIFLSIHQNYFNEPKYYGTQVFYSTGDGESELLASKIQEAVIAEIQPENTREIKESGSEVYLLYNAESTAVMVECGFLSNSDESEKLKNDDYQQRLAISIVNGITDYLYGKAEGEKNNGYENKKYFRVQ